MTNLEASSARSASPEYDGSRFVRYDASMAAEDSAEEADKVAILAAARRYVQGSKREYGHAVRAAHAKTYGGVRARVEILGGLPGSHAQGLFARPAVHEAVVRFSNGNARLGPDRGLGAAVGIGLKILGVEGPKLLDGHEQSRAFDLVMINAPTFVANDLATYVHAQDISFEVTDPRTKLYNFLTAHGSRPPEAWLWEELLAYLRLASLPVQNLLLSTYWTMGAMRYGDHMAKLSIAPAAESAHQVVARTPPRGAGPDFFAASLAAELEAREYTFELRAQLCTSLETMPVGITTRVWSEEESEPRTVARITLPRQAPLPASVIDPLSFNPWRVTEAHRPLGAIQRIRRFVYAASSAERHALNGEWMPEPRTLADLD